MRPTGARREHGVSHRVIRQDSSRPPRIAPFRFVREGGRFFGWATVGGEDVIRPEGLSRIGAIMLEQKLR
jgi:hypothetical protein